MKKNVLKTLIVLLVMSLVLTGCGGGGTSTNGGDTEEVINWTFYSPYGPQDSACCKIWADLFKQVEEATDGRLVITAYWSGQHPYDGSDMLRVVGENIAQLSHFYSGYIASAEPALTVDALPLLFPTDLDKAWKINEALWGGFNQDTSGVLERILQERWNASMIHMVQATSQRLMTMGYAADSIGSLTGHKVRVYSSEFAEFVKALGGTPVSLTAGEVYTSLATNLIDGAITSVVFADQNGYFDYLDTINLWEISQSPDGLMVNLDALNSLPDDIREIFLSIMYESASKPERKEVEDNDSRVEELADKGVTVVKPSDEERDKVKEIMKDKVWTPWAEDIGEEADEVLQYVESLK